MPHRALILCNGEPPSRFLLRRLAKDCDLIIAADGGANVARRCGIRPDVIIGDLDSVQRSTLRQFRSSTVLRVSRQDNTDLEKALDFVSYLRVRNAVIVGATGERIDFTLANLSVLWSYTSFLHVTVVGDGWRAMPVGRSTTLRARIGTVVSLVPFGECQGITLRGLQYPLVNVSMNVGEVGVSNVVRSSPFTVKVRRGSMLLIVFDKTLQR